VIEGVTANVHVRGSLTKPRLVLSSSPPLDQADILSLIVFNQPINQTSLGQQIALTQRAEALATGAVTGELANPIGQALNLDTFELKTSPGAAQVTLGQQVGPNLFVKVEQEAGDQSQTDFVLEYELTKWLRLQSNVRQESGTRQPFQGPQGSGIDLLFFFNY
jgi:translocation and assembly module TamB